MITLYSRYSDLKFTDITRQAVANGIRAGAWV